MINNKALREILSRKEIFTYLDLSFADFMQKLDGRPDDLSIFLAAAAASSVNRQGHVCFELSQVAGQPVLSGSEFFYPDLPVWKEAIRTSPAIGSPGDFKPLIFDGISKLYLHRYSVYQSRLASFIRSRIFSAEPVVISSLKKNLDLLFDSNQTHAETDWQKIACILSIMNRFTVISGGPGTGKTTTIVKIMALLLEMNPGKSIRINLAAPTGKAAARLQDAIREAKDRLPFGDDLKSRIPSAATTIHRLLGTIPGSPYFRYNENNHLDTDMVIIDESSMVDLALLSKLTQALPDYARLILVGDKDQLASVEAGSVFGDICDICWFNSFSEPFAQVIFQTTGARIDTPDTVNKDFRIQDCMVQLLKNYRFEENSGIQKVSEAVHSGDGKLAMTYMEDPNYKDITWVNVPDQRQLQAGLTSPVIRGFRDYLSANNPAEALHAFGKFQILCALREGPYGVQMVNRLIEEILMSANLI